ncbi:unnamed protein product [Cylindrotheca closterium]|uniref:Uncharacterized protein n=1 Tax=Cylindrotheca closterium TaxID=2856 RepID=A0AAD2JI29_9STRA|nr:unnamed protein product [Cylindrotheca closterium]
MAGTILLDETALDRALQKRGGKPQKSYTHEPYLISTAPLSSKPSFDKLLDEGALSEALRAKAEQRRSRARSIFRSPSRSHRTLRSRRSSRKSKSRNNSKSDKSLLKSSSYKSQGSSTYAESTGQTVATKSSHSHAESIEATSNHSSSAASPERGRTSRHERGRPSLRSKSEPSRQPQVVPMFHVHADTRQQQLERLSFSQSVASEPVRSAEYDDISVEKRSFFRQTVAADSVMQPVDYIDSPHTEQLLAPMGGAEVVEMIVSRFLLTGLEKPEVSAYIDQYDDDVEQLVHKIQGELVALGNMAMTDDMEELARLVPFHYQLMVDRFDMDLIAELWTNAYEHVWMNHDVDDSRQLAGPSHAVFNLNLIVKLYRRRMRARRWDDLMVNDEKRIEELKEQRRRRRSHSQDKRRQRRGKSVDAILSKFRGS